MKRVKAACLFQALVFAQEPEMGCTRERALKINCEEQNPLMSARAGMAAAGRT